VQFRFGLFGPLSVIHDGQAALMTSGNQRIVLAAPLVSTNQAVGAEYLIETIWSPAPPRSARVSPQNYVKRLRQNLGGLRSTLITSSCGYQICASKEVDILRFRQLARSGLDAPRTENWAQASGLLTTTLSFWRVRAFGDVSSALLAKHHSCHK
jgi:DNA-binding SARP family transcriptional activator